MFNIIRKNGSQIKTTLATLEEAQSYLENMGPQRNFFKIEEVVTKKAGSPSKEISDEVIDEKINKQIIKLMKSSRKKQNIRNKIYTNLLSLGYSNEMILRNINNYDFNN